MGFLALVIQAVSGVLGGNVGGALIRERSLGPLLNTVLGAVGGVAGGQLLGGWLSHLLGNATVGSVGASTLLGLALPVVGGLIKNRA